jgi:cutinase
VPQREGRSWWLLVRLQFPRHHDIQANSHHSQGAALAAAAISDVTTTVRNQIVGTVLFGYTKNLQNRGDIPNYPSDRLTVYCAIGDLVCTGTLTITAAHLSYGDEARSQAPRFLISKIGA